LVDRFREVVADPLAGAADDFGAGVPLETISHGPAAVLGVPPSVLPHPARSNTRTASRAVTLRAEGSIRISRR
jgi:hypothetical protein